MSFNYIIVQAGGKGIRMEILTRNKPKALVPVDNLPMIFHLFRKFPDKKFIIIGDYKIDVLKRYLQEFAEVNYRVVSGTGHKGTCAGIKDALTYVPDGDSFLLIWCDLVLGEKHTIPNSVNRNIIGIAKNFSCRWSYSEKYGFCEKESSSQGVAGYFLFNDKSYIKDVPLDGEFVRYLSDKQMRFDEQPLLDAKEYGLYSRWLELPKMRCRPFNSLRVKGDKVIKTGIDEQGRELAKKEIAWYKKVQNNSFKNIPVIYDYDPLTMEYIDGRNIYEYAYLPKEKKRNILEQIVMCLKEVHKLGSVPADKKNYYDAYLGKTYQRLEKVRRLVPYANDKIININGKKCRNIFYHQDKVERIVMGYMPSEFNFIHGDCTFSNTLLRHDTDPVLIDPRGYFGKIQYFGDSAYDWVKLYYSLFSNYDQFNLKNFSLEIGENGVRLKIASNKWEGLEDEFFKLIGEDIDRRQMKILLSLIWLSLTTYAWEDYDSICGAFYNGIWYLEEALEMENAYGYFEHNMIRIEKALASISSTQMNDLIKDCESTLMSNRRIVASGLGKNVPICEKFVGTLLSMGLDAAFLHTNSALHGDMGMIRSGDMVILLSKSGETEETIQLAKLLIQKNNVKIWIITFNEKSILYHMISNRLVITLDHEGDLWNIVPNNSTTINLIVLQTVAIELSRRLKLDLTLDFRPNHPGGAIGAALRVHS